MDKRILKEITKRWVKGFVLSGEALVAFADSGLTEDEIDYIQRCAKEIGERITDKDAARNASELVNEYYDFTQ